eukprot:282601-Pleurochrysis_carterae.AAC.3
MAKEALLPPRTNRREMPDSARRLAWRPQNAREHPTRSPHADLTTSRSVLSLRASSTFFRSLKRTTKRQSCAMVSRSPAARGPLPTTQTTEWHPSAEDAPTLSFKLLGLFS